jgi:hypothetical protein
MAMSPLLGLFVGFEARALLASLTSTMAAHEGKSSPSERYPYCGRHAEQSQPKEPDRRASQEFPEKTP